MQQDLGFRPKILTQELRMRRSPPMTPPRSTTTPTGAIPAGQQASARHSLGLAQQPLPHTRPRPVRTSTSPRTPNIATMPMLHRATTFLAASKHRQARTDRDQSDLAAALMYIFVYEHAGHRLLPDTRGTIYNDQR